MELAPGDVSAGDNAPIEEVGVPVVVVAVVLVVGDDGATLPAYSKSSFLQLR